MKKTVKYITVTTAAAVMLVGSISVSYAADVTRYPEFPYNAKYPCDQRTRCKEGLGGNHSRQGDSVELL